MYRMRRSPAWISPLTRTKSARRVTRSGICLTHCNTKDAHVVAAGDHAGLFRSEAAAQHRGDQVYPLRVVLQAARPDLLVCADADVFHADNIRHLLETLDILFEAREKCQMPIEPPVSATSRA